MGTPAWISLGSNLGDRRAILHDALEILAQVPGVAVRAVSSYHETRPVGGPTGQGAFLNAAAHLETSLDPHQLLETLQKIEQRFGRLRTVRWGERTIDLDLLFFGHTVVDSEVLRIPHPRLSVRRFVLAPLAEIASTFVDPVTGRMVANLLANLDRKPRLIAIDGGVWPLKAKVFGRLVEELPGFGISDADLAPPPRVLAEGLVHVSEALEREAEALKASRWAVETLRVPWIVTNYSLDFDILRVSRMDHWKNPPGPEDKARLDPHHEWKRRIDDLLRIALPPTIVLALAGVQDYQRRAGFTMPPVLWMDRDDPDAIVAEVFAVCRGIDGL